MDSDPLPSSQPQTCKRCAAPLPEPEASVKLCDTCYVAAADTCCSDANDASSQNS